MRARKTKGEGWDVFESSGSVDGPVQIMRVDDPGMNVSEEDLVKRQRGKGRERAGQVSLTPAFKGDDDAIRHVLALAKRGDKQALDALWEVLPYDGLLNRILWCRAMGWTSPRAAAYPEGFDEAWPPSEDDN